MMVKLDALEAEIDRIYDRYLHPKEQHPIGISSLTQAIGDVLRHFKKWSRANTIDAVPVVRCKDCKYSDVAYCRDGKTESKTGVWCVYNEDRHENNYYCADGERKDGDE